MAESGNENINVGFEEGMPWLHPTDALNNKTCDQKKDYLRYQKYYQPKRHHSRTPAAEPLQPSLRPQRTRNGTNTKWAIGGPGMQAVFLDSGQRSCGTGVFLPQRAGTHLQSSNKPACPPVLLPSRVVQALNLNVHGLGLQMKSQQECTSKQSKGGGIDCNLLLNTKNNNVDASAAGGAAAGAGTGGQCYSPEIFLPKEWTY